MCCLDFDNGGECCSCIRYTVSRMLMKTVGDGHLDPTRAYRGITLVERFIEMQPEAVHVQHAKRAVQMRFSDLGRMWTRFCSMPCWTPAAASRTECTP